MATRVKSLTDLHSGPAQCTSTGQETTHVGLLQAPYYQNCIIKEFVAYVHWKQQGNN